MNRSGWGVALETVKIAPVNQLLNFCLESPTFLGIMAVVAVVGAPFVEVPSAAIQLQGLGLGFKGVKPCCLNQAGRLVAWDRFPPILPFLLASGTGASELVQIFSFPMWSGLAGSTA